VDELPPPGPGIEAPTSGYLGVVLEDLPAGGLRIVEIANDSPAAKAGLKVGDKVTAVNQAAVQDIEELGALMEPVPPGGKLTLTVERDGKEIAVEATLGEPPPEPAPRDPDRIELGSPLGPGAGAVPPPGAADAPRVAGPGRASLGITVITFGEELRQRSDVPARSGALISTIRQDSPAARAGLPRGGVIVAFDGQRIDTAEELVEAIGASQPGQEVELSYYQGNAFRRKSVRLAAAADPNLLGPGFGGLRDRPLLGRVERALEGLAPPGAAGGAVPDASRGGAATPAESVALRSEIAELRATVEALQTRVAELEAKLNPGRPAPDADAPERGDR
jgi:membrane-associated protease RseP (regulator of RpoE activity)